ncbi:VOC family protein, partial [bacterium]|nr:VOC family protein [bacterium]
MRKSLFTLFLAAVLITPAFSTEEEFTSKVIQIGMIVSDLDASVKFYTDVVGLTEQPGFDVDGDFGKRSGLTDGTAFSVKVLKV